MTVGDGERLKRGSLTAEEIAKWAVEAWRLMDEEDMTLRTIQRKWLKEHNFYVSHVTIGNWVKRVRQQEKVLELYEPEQVRLGQLGKLERYQESTRAAVDNGEIPFDVGMKLLLSISKEISKLTNAAVAPTSKVEVTTAEAIPDMVLMEELRRVTEHEEKTKKMEESDGLD